MSISNPVYTRTTAYKVLCFSGNRCQCHTATFWIGNSVDELSSDYPRSYSDKLVNRDGVSFIFLESYDGGRTWDVIDDPRPALEDDLDQTSHLVDILVKQVIETTSDEDLRAELLGLLPDHLIDDLLEDPKVATI